MLERFLKDPKFLVDVFETMRDGLMVVDTEGTILFFNKAAEEITGHRREEVIGKSCTMLDSDTCVILTESGRQRSCDLFETGSMCNKKCRIRSGDGRSVYLLKNAVVLRDSSDEVVGAVESMTDITSLYMKELELEELKQELRQEYWFMGLLGRSSPMQRLFEQIRNAAVSEAPVLVCGESGSGKDLVARAIHKLSRRKEGPFIAMNCASLNDHLLESELFGHTKGSFTGAINDRVGRFEAANNGSIFLDEIGDMPKIMQVKLLRVLEEKVVERVGDHRPIPVNIRLISATNKELDGLIPQDRFREDLLYRINSIVVEVPPLRERREDIPIIAFHYLKKISLVNNKDIRRISPPAMEIIGNFSWPGNVRQLINALEHSAITCKGDTIEVSNLPDYLFREKKAGGNDERAEREKIRSALALYKGNKTLAAKHLGISRVTLWKRLKELGAD
ncbi:MAG: sigma 54-interacting transcriptional regulator [Nitrospirae bacterium]|nr:sigma 54-interacting transcriptional regulator [Nitrospirota bacterium]